MIQGMYYVNWDYRPFWLVTFAIGQGKEGKNITSFEGYLQVRILALGVEEGVGGDTQSRQLEWNCYRNVGMD